MRQQVRRKQHSFHPLNKTWRRNIAREERERECHATYTVRTHRDDFPPFGNVMMVVLFHPHLLTLHSFSYYSNKSVVLLSTGLVSP